MKKQKFTDTHVDIHDDGSATIHHVHASDPNKDVKHAVANLDGVHDSMEEHLNPNEEDALEEKVHPGIHQEIMGLKDKE
jgi:hypothetical protein